MTTRNKQWPILLLTVALAFAGCNRKTLYHRYAHTPLTEWERADTLKFSMKPAVRSAVVQRDVEVRISEQYPFQSLNLVIEQTTLPSNVVRRDTLDCKLIDPNGNILGDGITLFQYRFHLPDTSLSEGDSVSISIHHNMKREMLPGISDVGIRLTAY